LQLAWTTTAEHEALLQVTLTLTALPASIVGIAVVQNLVAALLRPPAGWEYVRRRP
jgi:hypothetical protein